MRKSIAALVLGVAAVAGAYTLWGNDIRRFVTPAGALDAKKKRAGTAVPVMTAVATESEMPVILNAPGIVEALATVAVKPRVDGQIVEIGFKEGDLVKEGQVLFRFDERLAVAQIRQAEANIAKDQALLQDALGTLERREKLLQQNYVSRASTETAKFLVENLKASIESGKASLEAQKTQLDYLTIRSPITGRTGSIGLKLGANVRAADATALVTINQTKPISVVFSVPQSELPALKRALDNKAPAEVTASGSRVTKLTGTIAMIDNQVDRTTGTVMAKVIVENAEELLWPGLVVDVALTVETKPRMVAVPASSVLPAQGGMIAWVIGEDRSAEIRRVTLDRIIGQTAYLGEGLKSGERVVTDGQLRLAPGTKVSFEDQRAPSHKPPEAGVRRASGRS
jgi:RND family efflux transporter MFP subunit